METYDVNVLPRTAYLRFREGVCIVNESPLIVQSLCSSPFSFRNPKVMRLYDKSVIYWRSTPGSDLPNSVPWHMIPVRPRQQMQPQPGDVGPTYTGGGGRKKIDSKVWFSSPVKSWYRGKGSGGGRYRMPGVHIK